MERIQVSIELGATYRFEALALLVLLVMMKNKFYINGLLNPSSLQHKKFEISEL